MTAGLNDDTKQQIITSDVVSFDIFDTLLTRLAAHPKDVFGVARELVNEKGQYFVGANFYQQRVAAEEAVREKSEAADVTLASIYRELAEQFAYPKPVVNALMEAELEAEQRLLRPDASSVALYEFARQQRKTIIITSDMYLPKRSIEQLLRKNGIDSWQAIIVSGDDGVAKADGSAFAHLIEKYPGKKIIHIGDNIHSDVNWPQRFGLTTIHTRETLEDMSHELRPIDRAVDAGYRYRYTLTKESASGEDIRRDLLTGLLARYSGRYGEVRSVAEYIGYGFLGPLLVAAAQQVQWQARQNGNDKVFFLARDGYILREAYNELFKKAALPNDYMLGSRRLLVFPDVAIQGTTKELMSVVAGAGAINVGKLLRYFAIDPNDRRVRAALNAMNIDLETTLDATDGAVMAKTFALMIEPLLKTTALREQKLLTSYFAQIGIDTAKTPLLCDIGWNGTMQRSISRLLQKPVDAVYLGLYHSKTSQKLPNGTAAVVDMRQLAEGARQAVETMFYEGGTLMLETIITNPHQATIIGLEPDKKGILQAVEGDHDFNAEQRNTIASLQAAALEFVRDFRDLQLPASLKTLSGYDALWLLERYWNHPSDTVAQFFGEMPYYLTASADPYQIGSPFATGETARKLSDQELQQAYDTAVWKQGFLKNCQRLGIPTEDLAN